MGYSCVLPLGRWQGIVSLYTPQGILAGMDNESLSPHLTCAMPALRPGPLEQLEQLLAASLLAQIPTSCLRHSCAQLRSCDLIYAALSLSSCGAN